jgi:hypothetical protein
MLDESHLNSLEHLQDYVKRRKNTCNAMVSPRSFNQGDLVLYENQWMMSVEVVEKGNFSPNWLGSYIVSESYGFGA